jgi:hypothetical protein
VWSALDHDPHRFAIGRDRCGSASAADHDPHRMAIGRD